MQVVWTMKARCVGVATVVAVQALCLGSALAAGPTASPTPARSVGARDAVAQLRAFVKDVQSARGSFTQTVTSPDGKKTRKSAGTLEFLRPNRFRFEYTAPMAQLIVGDGKKVWLYDADLNQVTVRPMTQALGATPAALLAGGSLDKDFVLSAVTASSSGAASAAPTAQQATKATAATASAALGKPEAKAETKAETSPMDWVEARPRHKDGQFQSVRVGFRQGQLAELEILDSFGQRSRLTFTQFEPHAKMAADRFQFTPPQGADVLEQP